MTRTYLTLLALAAMAVVSAAPAAAQSTRAELEALRAELARLTNRIVELEGRLEQQQEQVTTLEERPEPRVEPDRGNVRLELSGRINQAVVFADNGNDSKVFIADNDNSGSRFGLRGEADFGDITTGAFLEATFEVNSTDEISFEDDGPVGTSPADGEDFLDLRHAVWYIEHPTFGEFSLGFSNTATEEVSEVDLSGTGCCIGESDVDDIAGGLEFSSSTPGFELIPEVDDFFVNLDGSRTSRIRYDTPSLFGASLAVALRQDDQIRPDVALSYGAEFAGGFELEAAAGWRSEEDANVFHGSVSALAPFGVNLTLAGGVESLDDSDVDNPNFFYTKLGYREKFFDIGETRFSIDYFRGHNNDDFASPTGGLPLATSFGGGVVQQISPLSMEAYLGFRLYDVEDLFEEDTGLAIADPDGLFVVFTGARVRF